MKGVVKEYEMRKFYEDNNVIRELLYDCTLDNNKRFGA